MGVRAHGSLGEGWRSQVGMLTHCLHGPPFHPSSAPRSSPQGDPQEKCFRPVHRPQRPAGSTHSSTRGLRPPDAEFSKRCTGVQGPSLLCLHPTGCIRRSIESVMPSSHLILCCPLLLLPPIPPTGGSWKPIGPPGPARRLLVWCWRCSVDQGLNLCPLHWQADS